MKSFLKGWPKSSKDKTFLLYDIDVDGIPDKLKKIKNTTLLVSNPCIELWFLLHYKNQTANIYTSSYVKEVCAIWNNWKKSCLDLKAKEELIKKQKDALERAEKLTPNNKPSSTIPEIIKLLEK